MKKTAKLLLMAPILLTGCQKKSLFSITSFTYAYQTSEVQENTHDIYLAHCVNDIYIAVPEDYSKGFIELKKTGKMIYYYVYEVDHKVSNKGWEVK